CRANQEKTVPKSGCTNPGNDQLIHGAACTGWHGVVPTDRRKQGMKERRLLETVSRFLQVHFLWLLLGSYVAAALWPDFGLWIRDFSLGEVSFFGEKSRLTLPMLMLALLLMNAGLGVNASQLRNLLGNAPLFGAGLIANLVIPIAF